MLKRSSRYTPPVTNGLTPPLTRELVVRCLRWLMLVTRYHRVCDARYRPSWRKVAAVLAYTRRACYEDSSWVAPSVLKKLRLREFKLREQALLIALAEKKKRGMVAASRAAT